MKIGTIKISKSFMFACVFAIMIYTLSSILTFQSFYIALSSGIIYLILRKMDKWLMNEHIKL